jgi:hypothetical protein
MQSFARKWAKAKKCPAPTGLRLLFFILVNFWDIIDFADNCPCKNIADGLYLEV